MIDWSIWNTTYGHLYQVCRCGHFLWKHDPECYGVDVDDHSIRCECVKVEVLPPVTCSQCGHTFVIHDRAHGFSHCDDHTEWEAEEDD